MSHNKSIYLQIVFISLLFIITNIFILSIRSNVLALDSPLNTAESENFHNNNLDSEPVVDANLPHDPHQISESISLERLTTLPIGSNPDFLTNFRGQLLFYSNKTDAEFWGDPDGFVWLSDGTITNTVPLTLTIQFDQYGQPGFQLIDNRFIYADDAALWSSDGTATSFTTDFKIYNVDEYLESKGRLFLIADFGGRLPAYSLWRTDSTLEEIELLQDYGYTGTGGTGIHSLTKLRESIYYIEYAYQLVKLWRSDGTIAGTSAVVSFSLDYEAAETLLMPYNNVLYFLLGNRSQSSIELWRSDGTESGTSFVSRLADNCYSFFDVHFQQVNNRLYFDFVNSCNNTYQLWTSQGTSNSTQLLGTFNSIAELQAGGTGLFFNADDGSHGEELWFTDGTVAGTHLVKDIHSGPPGSAPSSLYFYPGTGYLYFAADDGANGSELWQSDGSNTNTTLLSDINPGSGDSAPASFVYIRPYLYFSANNVDFGRQVWKMLLPANEELFMPLVFGTQ